MNSISMILTMVILVVVIIILVYISLPTIRQKIYNNIETKKRKEEYIKKDIKEIYLTFDDGPHPYYTVELVKLLDKYNIKATFFVVAEFVLEHPQVIKMLIASGHQIGFHGREHKRFVFRGANRTREDFYQAKKIMEDCGVDVKIYRPPWGVFNRTVIKMGAELGWRICLWDVMVGDWKANETNNSIAKKLIDRVESGDVICLHDGRGSNGAPIRTIQALEIAIPYWLDKGYVFGLLR